MKAFFQDLFEYNHQSNQKIITQIMQHPRIVSERAVKLFSHILNAHSIWNARIKKDTPIYTVWQVQSIDDFSIINQNNFETTLSILSQRDLEEIIDYKTSTGIPFSNKIREILFHTINHSTYHRGQIVADIKQTGLEAVSTDYIFYKR